MVMPQHGIIKSPRTVAHGKEKYVAWGPKWLIQGTGIPGVPGSGRITMMAPKEEKAESDKK
jgi:hypothetical protein